MSSFVGLAIEGELAVFLIDVDGPAAGWTVDCFPVIELHHGGMECEGEARAGELIARNGLHAGVVRPPANAVFRCTLGQLSEASVLTTVEGGADPWREEAELSALAIDGTTGPASTVRYFFYMPPSFGSGALKSCCEEFNTDSPGCRWLVNQLDVAGRSRPVAGMTLLTATPGSLVPVKPPRGGSCNVRCEFLGITAECTVTDE